MTNKKIASEIAIGTIILLVIVIGSIVLMENKNTQADLDSGQYGAVPFVQVKAEIKAAKNVVFLGDSITALEDWNKLLEVSYITNAGIPGNTTDDILSRLSIAIKSKPQKVFLMIGVNDFLRGKDDSYVLANYETILNKIKTESPTTTVYIQSVLPINNDISKIGTIDSQKIIELNRRLKILANENKMVFIDLYPAFCGADNKLYGKYTKDGVHLSAGGYEAWKNLVSQYVR